jgi:cytochrome c biogenesis protein
VEILSAITGTTHAEVITVLDRFGLLDIYHSYYFVALLVILAINLSICTLKRLPSVFSILKRDVRVNRTIFDIDDGIRFEMNKDAKSARNILENELDRYNISSEIDRDSGKIYITGEKGKIGRLGVHIVHLGVLIIIAAGILGGLFGYSGNIGILEGDSDDSIVLKDNRTVKLPFKIKLENFELSYYDNSTKPKQYTSDIVISDRGPEKYFKVGVNSPAIYDGWHIYQASYGFYPSKDVVFKFNFKSGDIQKKISVKIDEIYDLSGGLSFVVRDFAPSLSLDREGKLINLNDMMINPAVIVEFLIDGESKGAVPILAKYPQTGVFDQFSLIFEKAYGVQFSVFSVSYNPFLWMVYAGFIILSAGIIIAFIREHTLVYVMIKDNGDTSEICLKGYRHRFKKDTDTILLKIKEQILKQNNTQSQAGEK